MAVTLATESPRSKVMASDVSAKALAVAKKNAGKHAPKRVTFFQGALLHPKLMKAIEKTDGPVVIVANLPYLPPTDKKIMPKSVTKYEPLSALFAKQDGMELNRKLLKQLQHASFFGPGCAALLEFDPPQSKKLLAFTKSLFPGAVCSIIRDRCGRERILKITVPQT
jgi:release factor glutamine methyltransferase